MAAEIRNRRDVVDEIRDSAPSEGKDLQAVIDRFLACSMKVEKTVEKPSRFLVDRVQGEVQGFERAQDLLRHFLDQADPQPKGDT